jgi:hypothetical protein
VLGVKLHPTSQGRSAHHAAARASVHWPSFFDIVCSALIAEDGNSFVFEKRVTMNDPGVRDQRVTLQWQHHLPGELVIGLTGKASTSALRRKGVIVQGWRGHGVRIRNTRFSQSVLVRAT